MSTSVNTMQSGTIEIRSTSPSTIKGSDISTFTNVTFPTPFPQGSNVIVIPMVQSFNGPDTPGVRIANVSTTGFKIRMNEVVVGETSEGHKALSGGIHDPETIGWIALSV